MVSRMGVTNVFYSLTESKFFQFNVMYMVFQS